MADDSAKLALSDQEPRANPSLDLITRPPALHVPAHGFDDENADSITLVQLSVRRS